jgi:hypothetical protein
MPLPIRAARFFLVVLWLLVPLWVGGSAHARRSNVASRGRGSGGLCNTSGRTS